MSNEMDEVDVSRELGLEQDSSSALRARAKAEAVAPSVGKPTAKRKFVPRELPISISLRDQWTNEALESWSVTSVAPDGGEEAQIVRYAVQIAGVPMDSLDAEARHWFKALARCGIQIRGVEGSGFAPTANPDQKLSQFIDRLWKDPVLLFATHRGLVEHSARFLVGDAREGEGAPQFPRVVVAPLLPSDLIPGAT
jgi:hypothetical protein